MGKVNDEWIEKQREKRNPKAVSYAYSFPDILDLTVTEKGPTIGIETSPQWDIPEKIGVNAALVGAFFTKRQNPNHPVQPDEIREQARRAIDAGASSVHFHVRDPETGVNAYDEDLYHEVLGPLRDDYPDTIFDATTVPYTDEDWETTKRLLESDLIDVSPINTTSTYLGDSFIHEPPNEIIERARLMQDHDVKPQLALYTDGDVDTANRYLIETGVLEEPYYWVVIGGLPGTTRMTSPESMVEGLKFQIERIREIPGDHEIVVCSAGRASTYLATLGIMMGCHLRVGTEDTIYQYPHKDDRVEDNGEEVEKFSQLAELLGREVATTSEYRDILGL